MKDRNDVLFEDDRVFAMLDQDNVVKGHVLVVWKNHKNNLSDMTSDEYRHFSDVVHHAEKHLLAELNVEKSIILKSGGLVSHFHFHIYPVPTNIAWETVKDLFDKKIAYIFREGEREEFIAKMKNRLQKSKI